MQLLILPPKRFQSTELPEFDPIRHKVWFKTLYARRAKLEQLKMAHAEMTACASIGEPNDPLNVIAQRWDVNVDDLRNYINFAANLSSLAKLDPKIQRTYQVTLNESYGLYCQGNAAKSIRSYIGDVAPQFNTEPAPVIEVWEIDPKFYPAGYKGGANVT